MMTVSYINSVLPSVTYSILQSCCKRLPTVACNELIDSFPLQPI